MFGLSWAELLLIAVVTIICVDPKDIPGLMRKVAQTVKKIRAFGKEFTDAVTQEVEAPKTYIKDLKGNLQQTYDISDIAPVVVKKDE